MTHDTKQSPIPSSSFTSQKRRICSPLEASTTWGLDRHRLYCTLCGHVFKIGEGWRWVYANDGGGGHGNFETCDKCDGPDVLERYRAACKILDGISRPYPDARWEIILAVKLQSAEAKVTALEAANRELREERDALRKTLIAIGRNMGCALADTVSTEFLGNLEEESMLFIERCEKRLAKALGLKADHPAHQYKSTACHHEKHDECRRTCKFCTASCCCDCHQAETPAPLGQGDLQALKSSTVPGLELGLNVNAVAGGGAPQNPVSRQRRSRGKSSIEALRAQNQSLQQQVEALQLVAQSKVVELNAPWKTACFEARDERDALQQQVTRLTAALRRIKQVTGTSTAQWHIADAALSSPVTKAETEKI